MSMHKLWVNPCPKCRHDVAQPKQAGSYDVLSIGLPMFAVVCDIGKGGCGHVGPVSYGEGRAIDAWNRTNLLYWQKEFSHDPA